MSRRRGPDRAPTAHRGLRDHAYERILQRLVSGEVEPGTRLTIDTIARDLGISPTPVREALAHLEATGLVTREALKGYRVAAPATPAELDELYQARLVLETTATRWATPASAAMLAELREAQQRHREAGAAVMAALTDGRIDPSLTADYFARDTEFHRVVLRRCGNRYLLGLSDSLGGRLHRMRQSALRGVTDVADAVAEHAMVVLAFEGVHGVDPEQAMRTHLENVRDRSVRQAEDPAALRRA